METLQEVAHAKTWCGQVQLAWWGQIIFKVGSKKKRRYYRMHAIISRGFYIFNLFLKPISLFLRRFYQNILSLCMASIQERFLIKSGL